jgi:alanine racemase
MRNTKITINKTNLLYNLEIIRNKAKNKKIIALIKSNAYGHGQIEIANILKNEDIFAFGIAYVDEAYILRNNNISNKLLIVVPITNNDIEDVVKLDLTPTIESLDVLVNLNEVAKKYCKIINFHLFINTGMNRDGADEDGLNLICENINNLNNVKLEAVMSHFSKSDDLDYSNKQIKHFTYLTDKYRLNNIPKHISNSGGVFFLDNKNMDFVRPGISIYGIDPFNNELLKDLKPVLELKTTIKNIIEVKKGDYIGYSFKYKAEKDMKIAILPLGYGDGYSYLLSNNARCIINDAYCNIISSICMDLIICDITEINASIGDDVILIGKSENIEITINEIAERVNTIPYEISTSLKSKIPRIVI